ncbi:MAG: tetratricopeptide repeat protein, partial [bacterium]
QSQFNRGNIWQAIGSLREAHRLDPYNTETALRLGLALIENRIYDQAYAVLAAAAAYAPNFPDLWEPLMAASYQDKRYADTIQACDWMLYYHIHEEEAYTNKAAAWGSLGQLQQAWITLRQAEQRFPNSGKVQLNLAITLYKMGLHKGAVQAWKKAARLVPSDPQVDQLRKVLHP